MKKEISYLLILIALFVQFSCKTNSKDENNYKKFPKNLTLNHKIIPTQINVKFNAILLYNSYLFVYDVTNTNYAFQVYDKNTFKFLKHVIKRGSGPNEINTCGPSYVDYKNGYLWVNDFRKFYYYRFHIDSLIRYDNYFPNFKINISKEYFPIIRYCSIDSNTLIFYGGKFNSESLLCVNGNNNAYSSVGRKPLLIDKNKFDEESNFKLYDVRVVTDPLNSKIVFSYTYFNRISIIYRDNKNKQIDIIGPELKQNFKCQAGSKTLLTDNIKEAYTQVKTDENFIYALYNGQNLRKSEKTISFNFPQTLHVFDWKGNPIIEIKLDISIVDFVIDQENNRIIASTPDEENPIILFDFNLNKILK